MHEYMYNGPVLEFDKCVANNWKANTYAVSESKARNNLAYRFKRDNKRASNVKITLPGKITMVK